MGFSMVKYDAMEMTDADMNELASLVGDEDKAEQQQLPRLKINYDTESTICKVGEFVVGQKKSKEGAIEEQGDKVNAFIAITARSSYSYYNQKDSKLNCFSPLFKGYDEKVVGSRLGNVCGKNCPQRHKEGNDKCKAQKVIFGVAITESQKLIDCVGYFAGTGFMPAADYIESAKSLVSKGKSCQTPICSHVAALTSEKQKNGSITYYIPIFTKVGALPADDVKALLLKREQIQRFIDSSNDALTITVEDSPTSISDGGYTPVKVDNIKIDTSFNPNEFVDAEIEVKKPAPVTSTISDDPDIAAAISAALGKI